MTPLDVQSRALGVFLFLFAHVTGLLLLWAAGPEHLEIGAMIIIACDFTILARAASRDRALLLPLLFAIVYALFHFSLLPIAVFDPQFLIVHPYFSYWYFGPFTKSAYWISLIFFIFVISGALMMRRMEQHYRLAVDDQDERRSDVLLPIFASLIAYFFVAVFYVLGIRDYAKYNELARATNAGLIGQSLIVLYPMIGAMAMLCADRVRSLKIFLILFALWALPAFAVGLRGAVLFPTALMIPLLVRRFHVRLRILPIAAVCLGLLWLISFGRLFRGSGDWTAAVLGASPIDALAELGGSLRPVFEVVRWTGSGTLDFFWGGTYWAPIERAFLKLMPFADPIPAAVDDRLMNVTIVKLAGGSYGFSIAAEAYANFGYAGAAVIGLLTGYVLTRIGRQFAIGRVGIFSAALAYALFYHIRQSYVGAWGSFILVAAFTWMMLWLDSTARKFLDSAKWPTSDMERIS